MIQFEGNRTTRDRALRSRLLIHEGDIYNDSLIKKSLARLNALRQFQEVTPLDVEIHNVNVERTEVDIIIRVHKVIRIAVLVPDTIGWSWPEGKVGCSSESPGSRP